MKLLLATTTAILIVTSCMADEDLLDFFSTDFPISSTIDPFDISDPGFKDGPGPRGGGSDPYERKPPPEKNPKPPPKKKPRRNDMEGEHGEEGIASPDSVVIAAAVSAAAAVLITIIVVLAVMLYKRSNNSQVNRNDVELRLERNKTNEIHLQEKGNFGNGSPQLPPPRQSVPNIYATHGNIDDDTVYQTVEITDTVPGKGPSPLTKRYGPLPHTPISIEETTGPEEDTPLTPPRPGVDDYYSYAGVVPQPVDCKEKAEIQRQSIKSGDYSGTTDNYIDTAMDEELY